MFCSCQRRQLREQNALGNGQQGSRYDCISSEHSYFTVPHGPRRHQEVLEGYWMGTELGTSTSRGDCSKTSVVRGEAMIQYSILAISDTHAHLVNFT